MKELSEKEMNHLIGGVCSTGTHTAEVENVNRVSGCTCTFLNLVHQLKNTNEIEGCICKCISDGK